MNSNYNINSNQEPYLTTETVEFLQKTINRYKKSRERVLHLLSSKQNELGLSDATFDRVSDCGSWLEFRNYYRKDKTKLHNANFCKKDKLCPACATRRASKQVKKVSEHIEHNPDLKNKNWYYIVLPVEHNIEEDFKTVFQRATDGLQKIRMAIKDNKRGKGKQSFFSKFDGLFYSFEVTKSKNGWNVHINLLCCSDKEIKGIYKYTQKDGSITSQHRDIMLDWSKYTDNYSFMHSINKLDTTDMMKNLVEVFKYALKFQELKDDDLVTVYKETQNKRLLGAFGILYNIKTDVPLQGDEILDDVYLEIIYRCNPLSNEYTEHSRNIKHEPKYHKFVFSLSRSVRSQVRMERERSKHKFVLIKTYDKFGFQTSKELRPITKNLTDFDIFAHSLYTQKMLS